MPIYLDRHDASEDINAEHVAKMHQLDMQYQHEYGCKGFTYWFDDKRKAAFCLIEAPDKESIKKMHHHAHGDVPSQIIEVDEGLVNSFLGRLDDPCKIGDEELIISEPAFRIIMVSDIKISSLLKRQHNGDDLQGFKNKIPHVIKRHQGNLVSKKQNQYLYSFVSVSNALHCAIELQQEFEKFAGHSIDSGLHLKIGLNSGNPVTEKEHIFEETIALAEIMCAIGKGIIIISSEVKSLALNENFKLSSDKKQIHTLDPAEELFLVQLMEYMEGSFQQPNLKIDDLCLNLGLSKSNLYRKMKMIAGKSPNAFIKDYRLEKALELLSVQKGNISEIAFETGFNSPAYFSKCFIEGFGMLPSSYSKMIANPSLSLP